MKMTPLTDTVWQDYAIVPVSIPAALDDVRGLDGDIIVHQEVLASLTCVLKFCSIPKML